MSIGSTGLFEGTSQVNSPPLPLGSGTSLPAAIPFVQTQNHSPLSNLNNVSTILGGTSSTLRQSLLEKQILASQQVINNQVDDINSLIEALKTDLQNWKIDLNSRLGPAEFFDQYIGEDKFQRAVNASDALESAAPNNPLSNTLQLCLGVFKPFKHLANLWANENRRREYTLAEEALKQLKEKHRDVLNRSEGKKFNDEIESLELEQFKNKKLLSDTYHLSGKALGSIVKMASKDVGKGISKFVDLGKGWKKWNQARNNISILDEWKFCLNSSIFDQIPEERQKEVADVLKELQDCSSLAEVEKALATRNLSIELPRSIEEWKKLLPTQAFANRFAQHYLYRNGLLFVGKKDAIELLLEKRKAASQRYLEKVTILLNSIAFSTSQGRLKEFNLSFNDFPNAPQTQSEWDQLINDPVAKKSLCQHFANQLEAHDIMTEKALRVSALKKIDQEYALMSFNSYEHLISIPLNVLQMALCIAAFKVHVIGECASYLFVNLPGAPFANIIYPKLELSGISLTFCAISYLFAHCKGIKPHAYSREWMKTKLILDITQLKYNVGHLMYSLKKLSLLFYVELIEKRIWPTSHPMKLEEHARYKEISAQMDAFCVEKEASIKELCAKLGELNLKDAQALLKPKEAAIEEEDVSLARYRQEYAAKMKDVDSLSVLIESMGKIEKDCVPPEFLSFCKRNIGTDLDSNQKNLQGFMESFFIQGGNKFVTAFQDPTHYEWSALHKRGRLPTC